MNMRAMLAALFCALTGCSNLDQLKPGITRADEVISLLGEPSMRWDLVDGSQLWEYAGVPSFEENRLLVIGRDRILRELRNPHSDQYFNQISIGMDQDEVRRVLGRPLSVQKFALSQQEVWDWLIEHHMKSEWRFNVHFDTAGLVTAVSKTDVGRD